MPTATTVSASNTLTSKNAPTLAQSTPTANHGF